MKDNATRLKTSNDNTTEGNVGDQMIEYTTHKATNGNTADSYWTITLTIVKSSTKSEKITAALLVAQSNAYYT